MALSTMLIRRATLLNGDLLDIRVHTRIYAVALELPALHGEVVVDADGGLVLPGLHDHHVHIRSAAAALGSLPLGPRQVVGLTGLATALSRARPDDDGWIRAVGTTTQLPAR